MLEADCSVVAESCTLLTELRLTTETLLSVDDVRPIAELLTNCRLATELLVVLLELTTTLLSRPTSDTEFCVTATKLTIGSTCSISTTISETLGEVLTISEREALPCSCKEEVAFCVEAETTVFNLLTSCRFAALLAVVVESVVLLLEASVMFETEAAVEDVICVAELPLSVIVEDADAVLETTEAALLFTTAIEDVELCVVAAIETSEEVSCSPKNQDDAIG